MQAEGVVRHGHCDNAGGCVSRELKALSDATGPTARSASTVLYPRQVLALTARQLNTSLTMLWHLCSRNALIVTHTIYTALNQEDQNTHNLTASAAAVSEQLSEVL